MRKKARANIANRPTMAIGSAIASFVLVESAPPEYVPGAAWTASVFGLAVVEVATVVGFDVDGVDGGKAGAVVVAPGVVSGIVDVVVERVGEVGNKDSLDVVVALVDVDSDHVVGMAPGAYMTEGSAKSSDVVTAGLVSSAVPESEPPLVGVAEYGRAGLSP